MNVNFSELTRDPGDEHVVALAVIGCADYLFTHDRGYLAVALAAHNITLTTPDDYLTTLLEDDAPTIAAILRRQADAWGGGRPLTEPLEVLERAGARGFARSAAELLSTY